MPPTRHLLRLQNEKKFDELNPKITNKIKTMSKIMGRLIMLAAIFFAPMLVLATSCGPQTEGPCNECGPHTNAWSLDYCPSQTNSSSVTPASFCNQIGDAPTMPTNIAAPIYQPGQKETHTSYDCTNTTYQYAGISYTVGSVQWDPSIPGAFGLGNVPSFSSQAYVNVTSSNTNLCSSPGRVNIGSVVTWNVANNSIDAGSIQGNINNGGKTWSVDWQAGLTDIENSIVNNDGINVGNVIVLSDPSATSYLTYNWWKQQKCCPNGAVGNIDKEWYTGSASYSLGGQLDFTALSAFPEWYQQIISVVASLDTDWMNNLSQITGFGHFSVGANAIVNGNTTIRAPFEDDCYGCNSTYTTGESVFNANVVDSVASTLCGGINLSVTGYFNSDLKEYGIAISPPNPVNQINIYEQDTVKYSLYSYAKVGAWTPGGVYWIQPGSANIPNPAQVINTVCTSPNL